MIQIIFDEEKDRREGYIDCCHIIIDDHGIKQQKVIRTETLYELLEKTKEHKKKELFLGRVPRGYLATKQRIEDFPKIQSKTAIFLEEDVRRIIYENSVYEIPIPNLMMIHSVTTNGCVSTDLFCLEKDMDKKTAAKLLEEDRMPNLYQWPFANVSGAGGVCYGSNNIRKIERLSDLDILPILFFDSPMNSDYYTPHRTTLGKATIRELITMKNDVNGQMDLLDLLGIEKEVEQKPEKETETKNTKETKKTENVSNTSKVSEKKTETKKYKCPIVVYGGPYSYTINEENKEMSSTEVKKHVIKTFPELKGIVTVKMQEDNSCILQVEYKETKLPEIKDQGIFTVKLGKEYVISNEGVEEAVIAWNKKFPQYVGCNYHYVNNNDHVLIPFYKSDSKQVLRAYKLPVLIGFPEMMEQIKPDKDQEDQTISGAEIMERYSKTHPEFKDCTFKYIEHTNTIIPLKEKAVYVPDICMIQLPITVATGGYHIQFSADDFHGKDIVTMEEIRKALEATYPEYSKERTSMTYDKRHFIIAMLKSSTKGATIVSSREGFHREVNENGVTEYRPYGKFVLTGKNQLDFSLNSDQLKIPKKLLSDIIDRFRMDIHRECALQLFMTKDEKGYWLYEPRQTATSCDVTFERNNVMEDEYVLVMDIHSHGKLPTFFSATDNRDEKGIRLYMVIGNFSEENPRSYNIMLRAGMNGVFQELSVEDIFV